ncbi:MAG: site-specific DNA-methyltransferase [Gammaproteobacteria bacterium]|nr:site-specific DNA-methyltransferase [Gammaproteobacteria bacterium]
MTTSKTADLIPYINNARTHSDEQVTQIAASIKEFGFINPVIVDGDNGIIAGHGRIMAAQKLGIEEVPTVEASHLSEAQKKAYILADNKMALNAGWDDELLALEIADLKDLEFDLSLTGFDSDELADLMQEEAQEGLTDEDAVPELPEEPTTKRGDVWVLGNHRLMCGDSTMIDDVEKLMDGNKADLLHTDPPYNVDYSNANRPKPSKTNLGVIKNDSMDGEKFYQFLLNCFLTAYTVMKNDSSAYVWHTSSEHVNFTNALIDSGFKYTQQIIWKKPMLLGRGRYQWAHEPCLLGVKGSPYFTDDRTKTTVWDFGGYDKSKNMHPTQKPLFIPEEAVNNSSKIGSNVLDLFGGSGSTLIACEKTNRNCFMMELDEKYCDVIMKRWEEYTGNTAVLLETDRFDEAV